MTRTSGLERLVVRDQVFQLIEGWHFVVGGRVHGVFADRASAESEMAQQQQAEYDLKRSRVEDAIGEDRRSRRDRTVLER